MHTHTQRGPIRVNRDIFFWRVELFNNFLKLTIFSINQFREILVNSTIIVLVLYHSVPLILQTHCLLFVHTLVQLLRAFYHKV
jgi:hypothetical protein